MAGEALQQALKAGGPAGIALARSLLELLAPRSAEAEVRYHDPESEALGAQIKSGTSQEFHDQVKRAVLEAAEREAATVNVYGSSHPKSQAFYAQPRYQDTRGFYSPSLQDIYLAPEGMTDYTYPHELVHFLQHKRQPEIPPSFGPEDYPNYALGVKHAPIQAGSNPLDTLAELYTKYDIKEPVPYRDIGLMYEFLRGIIPFYPAPTARQPQ